MFLEGCTDAFREHVPSARQGIVKLGAGTQEVCHCFPVPVPSQEAPPAPLGSVLGWVVLTQVCVEPVPGPTGSMSREQ
eukprot:1967897-Rhodomonas_salina.1